MAFHGKKYKQAAAKVDRETLYTIEGALKLLKDNPRYQIALRAAGDIAGFAQGLQRAGYATDPSYAQKLKAIADGPVLRNALQRINIPSWEV